jgi:hypothetical protein
MLYAGGGLIRALDFFLFYRRDYGGDTDLRLVLLFVACLVVVGVASVGIGLLTGFVPGILPVIIATTLLTAAVNNRLESRRIKKELQREGLE